MVCSGAWPQRAGTSPSSRKPLMYKKIAQHPGSASSTPNKLEKEGVIGPGLADKLVTSVRRGADAGKPTNPRILYGLRPPRRRLGALHGGGMAPRATDRGCRSTSSGSSPCASPTSLQFQAAPDRGPHARRPPRLAWQDAAPTGAWRKPRLALARGRGHPFRRLRRPEISGRGTFVRPTTADPADRTRHPRRSCGSRLSICRVAH